MFEIQKIQIMVDNLNKMLVADPQAMSKILALNELIPSHQMVSNDPSLFTLDETTRIASLNGVAILNMMIGGSNCDYKIHANTMHGSGTIKSFIIVPRHFEMTRYNDEEWHILWVCQRGHDSRFHLVHNQDKEFADRRLRPYTYNHAGLQILYNPKDDEEEMMPSLHEAVEKLWMLRKTQNESQS